MQHVGSIAGHFKFEIYILSGRKSHALQVMKLLCLLAAVTFAAAKIEDFAGTMTVSGRNRKASEEGIRGRAW